MDCSVRAADDEVGAVDKLQQREEETPHPSQKHRRGEVTDNQKRFKHQNLVSVWKPETNTLVCASDTETRTLLVEWIPDTYFASHWGQL